MFLLSIYRKHLNWSWHNRGLIKIERKRLAVCRSSSGVAKLAVTPCVKNQLRRSREHLTVGRLQTIWAGGPY